MLKSNAIRTLAILGFLSTTAGAQVFSPSGQDLPGVWAGSADWGDYDNDGDPDLLLTGLTGPNDDCEPITRVYRNDGGSLVDIGAGLPGVHLGKAAWGDYDGDGDLDIALTGLDAADAGLLRVYANIAGSFARDNDQTEFVAVRYSSLAWSDLDRDGDLDLVVTGMSNSGSPQTVLYRNSRIDRSRIGRPLGGSPLLEIDGPNTERLVNLNKGDAAWGDIDGDGDADLALTGYGTGGTRQTLIYRNDNGNLFQDDRNNGVRPVSQGSLAWGDVDNDGDLDLALSGWSNEWQAVLEIYINAAGILRSDETFSSTRVIGSVAWGDVDNDGDLDLLASGQTALSDRQSFILRNDPLGTLSASQSLTGLRGSAAGLADVDGDGDLDVLLSGEDADAVRHTQIWTSTGAVANTAPAPPDRLESPIVTGQGISLSWNDGDDDHTGSAALSYSLRIGTSSGGSDIFSGTASAGPGNVSREKNVRLTIPLARDTYFWSVRAVDGAYRPSPEAQEQTFQVQDLVSSEQSLRSLQNSAMAWGDYDNDGDLDLALAGSDADGNARSLLYTNDNGSLAENSAVSLIGVQDGDAAWGDFDNDGDLDLLLTGGDQGNNRYTHLYRNRLESGDFALNVANVSALPQLSNSSAAFGDVDNDGDLDLALVGQPLGDRAGVLYLNTDGQYAEDASQSLTPMDNGDLAWADVDGDGDLDLAAIGQTNNQGGSELILYLNDAGQLTADTRSAFTGALAASVAFGDFDGDGDPDLAANGFNPSTGLTTFLYTNDGTGRFTESGQSLDAVAAGDLAWGDFDNDGDADLAQVGQAASGRILKVYRNNGGTLEAIPISVLTGIDFGTVTWADIDNDGDLDLAGSGRTSPDATNFLSLTQVNDNLESRFNPNRLPNAPSSLQAVTSGASAALSWSAGSDLSGTPQPALTYAIRVGDEAGGSQIVSEALGSGTGPITGTGHTLSNLLSGTYFWSARTIDAGLASSDWSSESSFIVDTLQPTVDSVQVRPRVLGPGRRATVVVTFNDEPAGMDNSVSPNVSLVLTDGERSLNLTQVSYSGGLWIGEVEIQADVPGGTVVVNVLGAADLKGNVMAPFQAVIPALILPGSGGVVESGDQNVRMVITPGALPSSLSQNPDIEIIPITVLVIPDNGGLIGSAYSITSNPDFDFALGKSATLSFRYTGGADPNRLAVYHDASGGWARIGGTVDAGNSVVRVPITDLGVYALVEETTSPSGSAGIANIRMSNRAFHPRRIGGGGAPAPRRSPLTTTTDISFDLGAPATVRVEMYDRNGRLLKVLEAGRPMGSGRQVVTWDGRDADDSVVRSGLYIVVIQADGEKAHKTLAVVNN